jgi:hypothetical protein
MAKATEQTDASEKRQRAPRLPISGKTKMVLWARAAGRCQYSGCNHILIGDLISGRSEMNASYIAHIIADASEGPRGDAVLSPKLATDVSNLMLMCDKHHRLIDREDVASHPPDLLRAMKQAHERRIETLSAMTEDKSAHVLRFAARIGANESPVALHAIKAGMLPDRYPAEGDKTIDLDITGLELADSDPEFWTVQIRNLRAQFAEKVRGRFERGEIKRLAVFSLAPIPLLIELGRLISDIADAEVMQLLREPKGWAWQETAEPLAFQINECEARAPRVALKLEVSAPISDERVHDTLGTELPIWSISVPTPHNDIIRRRDHLRDFRQTLRRTFEAIKARNGEGAHIHLFPATPVSTSVEIGRVWMPKAHLPMTIYDQNRAAGGFRAVTKIEHLAMKGAA